MKRFIHGYEDGFYQLVGLIGFVLAGFVFIGVGIRFGDTLTVVGSVLWIFSCLVWMIPLLRKSAAERDEPR